jgi:RHS repeat-associated protein
LHDENEGIEEIIWRVDSKISEVVKTNSPDNKSLKFEYDAMDNRIAKHVYNNNSFLIADLLKSTYYLRDASGNVMAVYELVHTPADEGNEGTTSMKVTERHIYGSSRLGIDVQSIELIDQQGPLLDTSQFRILGLKQYEISNHLGNVLSVISDVKIPVVDGGLIISYRAVVVSATDYSPFGVGLYERSWSAPEYRYGFNGKEKDDEFSGEGNSYDFGARIYDGRLGRWLSVDKFFRKFAPFTPYNFCINSPIFIIDIDGNDIIILSVENNVGGLGHAAVLIGDDKSGWTLYSKNGTTSSMGASGPQDKHPQNGIFVGSLENFATEFNLGSNGEVEYTSAFRIETDEATNDRMAEAASKEVAAWYDVSGTFSGSCIDVCSKALEAGGLDPGTKMDTPPCYPGKGWAIAQTAKTTIPNERYERITSRNKGEFVAEKITPSKQLIDQRKAEFAKFVAKIKEVNKEILSKESNSSEEISPADALRVVPKIIPLKLKE